ncbi:MAG: GIY-YIG nuclease family protein [Isosphaerales bacterium]
MIYFAQLTSGAIKIGTTKDVEARLSGLANHYGMELALLATMPGDRSVEAEIHERFTHLRIHARKEQFRPGPDLMAFIGRPLLVDPNPDVVEAVEPARLAVVVTLKGSLKWKAWLDRLSDQFRTDNSKVIDMALVEFAKAHGFKEEAPRR